MGSKVKVRGKPMVRSDDSQTANLPQGYMKKRFPSTPYVNSMGDDTLMGIDQNISSNAAKLRGQGRMKKMI